jgi:hypothetical protein
MRAQDRRTARAVRLDDMRMALGHLALTALLGGLQVLSRLQVATSVPSVDLQV